MFIAVWDTGPNARLLAETWMQAIEEALRISIESLNRDNLIAVFNTDKD